jgi:GT2 family glycosyltransferase
VKTLTVAICSYQRRDAVLRLVSALDEQARDSPESWRGIDVCVVLDGSDDGSREALDAYEATLPLRTLWQPNAGAAAARNRLIDAANGEVIWFLDDDLVPAEGTVDRHRRAHEHGLATFYLGPCLVPPDFEVPAGVRDWWVEHYGGLAEAGGAQRFDEFFIANASAPIGLVRSIGYFDERFTAYGWEDFEFGARVLAAGSRERYDADAVAWHYTATDDRVAFGRQRVIGRSTALMFQLHPELASEYFPQTYPRSLFRIFDRFRIYSPLMLQLIAILANSLLRVGKHLGDKRSSLLRSTAWDTSYLAGIAETDREVLLKALGRPKR